MLEMNIESIRVSLLNYQRVVILRVKESNRYLPIWIGPSEADAIAMKLQEYSAARPMTHDLLSSVIVTLGATVDHIIVSELANDTFYAKIILQVNGNTMEIDSRPSDAIALAVRAEAPIYAVDEVVNKAGVEMDEETGKAIIPHGAEVRRAAPPPRRGAAEPLGIYRFHRNAESRRSRSGREASLHHQVDVSAHTT